MKGKFTFPAALLFFVSQAFGQGTYHQIYTLFQTKCTPGCHSGSTPTGNLDLSADSVTVYNRLVNGTPTNPAAVSAGLKLVTPGYPYLSYLMKKCNNNLDPQNGLTQAEGLIMPYSGYSLTKQESELIRQWIVWGAPISGSTYNSGLINAYYDTLGVPELPAPPTPADEGREGYQVKFGPIFLGPQDEFEFFQVYNPGLETNKEIIEMDAKVPVQCHHWAIRTISQAGANAMGISPLAGDSFSTQILVYQYTKFMAIWQFSDSLKLPQGTAHFQDSGEALVLDLHVHNNATDSILAATAYLNIYTQPMGSGAIEMVSDLWDYGGSNPFILNIPPTNGGYDTVTGVYTATGTRYYWNIQSHTHSRGKSFNMFLRNPDGSKGTQFYDGFYNTNYTYNQGYFDYSQPPVRTFDPMMPVDMSNGMIFQASWQNNTPDTIPFGLTTKQEMYVVYFQYTNELPAALKQVTKSADFSLYPNPGNSRLFFESSAPVAEINIYNSLGQLELTEKQPSTNNISVAHLASGIYIVEMKTAEGVARKNWVKM